MDAEGWLAMNHAAITEGRWRPNLTRKSERVSFEEYSELWLQRRELKPRTRREYEKLLVDLQEEFGRRELQAITSERVRRWYESLDRSTPSRRAHLYALLRTVMGSAVVEELILVNPSTCAAPGKLSGPARSDPRH